MNMELRWSHCEAADGNDCVAADADAEQVALHDISKLFVHPADIYVDKKPFYQPCHLTTWVQWTAT